MLKDLREPGAGKPREFTPLPAAFIWIAKGISPMAKPLQYNASLVERVDLTPRLALFRIQPGPNWGRDGEGQIPDFEGGQYCTLGLNNDEQSDKGSVSRAYSVASPPEEKRWLEFYIRYVDQPASDNPLTHLLWKLRPGDPLWLGPKIVGHFTLAKTVGEDDPRLKVFVAAGTGLAPFVSMILSWQRRELPLDRFAVLHGVSHPEDLGYREDLQTIFADMPSRYLPTVSRPAQTQGWTGQQGRVETFFDTEKLGDLEQRLGFAEGEFVPERAVVYICGLYGTIHNTLVSLLRRGFVPNDRTIRRDLGLESVPASLFFEQYDSVPVLDTKNREEMARLLADSPLAVQRTSAAGSNVH